MGNAPKPLTVNEFLEWCERQPSGRFELVSGEVIAMSPERVAHARMKGRIWEELTRSIAQKGLPCEALPDGLTVRIDETTAYEPDALVHCSESLSPNAVEVPEPIVVVEVLSPSTRGRDSGAKLEDYFRLASVVHYLLVKTDRPALIHHHRLENGEIRTSIHHDGKLELAPPGIILNLDIVLN